MPEAPQTMTAGATDTPLACARDAFHIEGDVRYLNCAYLAPLLKRVEAAGIDGIRRRRGRRTSTPRTSSPRPTARARCSPRW
jgi:anti-sigma factor RsiW